MMSEPPYLAPGQIEALDWDKTGGLLPAIVQDARRGTVLMLGYMNRAALEETLRSGHVTFYSRSRQQLWTKGETSGNVLRCTGIAADCDRDTLLVLALPAGPTCHTGARSCFGEAGASQAEHLSFLAELESVIEQRIRDRPEGSYTARLWSQGTTRMAQKVGEEGLEVALAAATQEDEQLVSESADLLFHLALLLKNRGLSLSTIAQELERRHAAKR